MAKSERIKVLERALPDDEEIKSEYKRLLKLYENAPQNRLELALKLISRAAFMGITLDRMERDVVEHGWEDDYQNGVNQSGKKESPAAKLHISMTKNFTAVLRQLDLLLGGETGGGGDAFTDF